MKQGFRWIRRLAPRRPGEPVRSPWRAAAALATAWAIALVSACGGGGGDSASAPPPVVSPPPSLATDPAYVKAFDAAAGDYFGYSIALSTDGSTLAVGAPFEDSRSREIDGNPGDDDPLGAETQIGAVYVYVRNGDTWVRQAYVKAWNAHGGSQFGFSVALSADGSTLAVGAWQEAYAASGVNGTVTGSLPGSGAAYVYTRSGSTWSQQAYVKASNPGRDDGFGHSVALSADGNTLAVGSVYEASASPGINGNQADDSAPDAGAVYVFTRNGSSWSQQAYVKASNPERGDDFGYAVALSANGNRLAVGAIGEDSSATGIGGNQADNSAPRSGAVYVFDRTGASWSQSAYVKASNAEGDDWFGYSVSLSGDGMVLAVSAVNEESSATGVGGDQTNNGAPRSGAAYVFAWSDAGVLLQQAYIKASNAESGDFFGERLALSADGKHLVVGATGEDSAATGIGGNEGDNSAPASGAAYVFSMGTSGWSQRAYVKASNPDIGDTFGRAVALNRDGTRLAVSAMNEAAQRASLGGTPTDNSAPGAGAVYVY